jgi:hypothetical protein
MQGAVHFLACSLNRRWYHQISEAGDRPGEHNERLACGRVRDGEREREVFAASTATCQVSSSMNAVKVQMSALHDDTGATQADGVTSAILSASWTTSSRAACPCVTIMA